MTKVSVLLITIRHGGLDWQLRYLAQQTHPVDEFIVVDGYYDLRHESTMALAKELNLNLVHLREPLLSYHTSPNRCSNINFAIAHARYPLCVIIDDWHALPDNFIEAHVALYNVGYAGVARWIQTPFMMLSDYNSFVDRAKARRPNIDDARYHFTHKQHRPFTEERGRAWMDLHIEDSRIRILNKNLGGDARGNIVTDIPTDWWWPNSVGVPLKYLLATNGFDETFNGGGGCEDVDIATRMSYLGLRFAMDTRVTCYHVDHVIIPTRSPAKPMCSHHDKSPFTSNEYYKGDQDLIENEQLTTWNVDGVKFCKCKVCGWQGLIDSTVLLRWNQKRKIIQAPLESLGIQRTNLKELRASLGLPAEGPIE